MNRLKFDSWIYRKTGYYSSYARLCEYRHILSILPRIEETYNNQVGEDWDLTLDDIISIEIGCWQGKQGFYRPHKSWRIL